MCSAQLTVPTTFSVFPTLPHLAGSAVQGHLAKGSGIRGTWFQIPVCLCCLAFPISLYPCVNEFITVASRECQDIQERGVEEAPGCAHQAVHTSANIFHLTKSYVNFEFQPLEQRLQDVSNLGKVSCLFWFICSFIQHLLCTKHQPRHSGYNRKLTRLPSPSRAFLVLAVWELIRCQ